MYRLFRPAQLALDLATPVEGAGAPLDHRYFLGLVAPAAAHQVASVDADAGVVALAAVGAEYTELGILLAERRRRLQVDEVPLPGWLVLRMIRLQLEVVTVPAAEAVAMRVHGVARRVADDGVVVVVVVAAHAVRVADHHPGGAVEAVLENVADHAEIRQPHPTGLHRARARHAVTLALLTHLQGHVL